ncbi:c-type cytochrome [Stenotrophomonas mori]|uniref:C-type cytochrome n=1 Tax=Stenotrophomonas mori TaxID=2871096 RepID=A0ABT0SKD0_9GAMM|nr:c-type cytochrome [Stenotrophomonas mori]MCL7715794.1 c-type cytochrome [Stenotrophomonas mori]
MPAPTPSPAPTVGRRGALLAVSAALLLSACGQRDAFNHAGDASPEQRALERAFAICAGCHDTRADLGHRVGPNLHGVVGRPAGSAPGYPYSDAMKRSGIVWDAQTLDAFLASPQKQVPGNRMLNTTSDPARRQAVIEYLTQQQ